MTLQQYKDSSAVEKIVVVHLEPFKRESVWTDEGGNIWSKTVEYTPVKVRINGTTLTEVFTTPTSGEWWHDSTNNLVKVYATQDPSLDYTTVNYRLYLASKPITLPFDMSSGYDVPYEGLIDSISDFVQELDDQQRGITIESRGSIAFANDREYWNGIFDKFIYDNQPVNVWLYSPTIGGASDSIKLFSGTLADKGWSDSSVKFNIRDYIYQLRDRVPLPLYNTDSLPDILPEQNLAPKRRVYGRVDNLWPECLDNEGEGATVTGTFTGTSASKVITGTGTSLKDEVSVGDTLIFSDGSEIDVESINSVDIGLSQGEEVIVTGSGSNNIISDAGSNLDFSSLVSGDKIILEGGFPVNERGIYTVQSSTVGSVTLTTGTLSNSSSNYIVETGDIVCVKESLNTTVFTAASAVSASFIGLTGVSKSLRPSTAIHRTWAIAEHACHNPSFTITGIQLGARKVDVTDAKGVYIGDTMTIDGSSKTVTSVVGNTIEFAQSIAGTTLGSTLTRNPLQSINLDETSLAVDSISVDSNDSTDGYVISLDETIEFDSAPILQPDNEVIEVINGSNVVYSSSGLFEGLQARDWVKIDTVWYEVWEIIAPNVATVRANVSASSGSYTPQTRRTRSILDESILLVDVYGITEDGTPTGTFVETVPDAIKHLLTESGVSVDASSFTTANDDTPWLVSMAIPFRRRDNSPSLQDVLKSLNDSVIGAISNNNEFEAKMTVYSTDRDESTSIKLNETDPININVRSDPKFVLSAVNIRYRPQDVEPLKLEDTDFFEQLNIENDEIGYSGRSQQKQEITAYLYNQKEAEFLAYRTLLLRSLARLTLNVESFTQLIDIEIGDVIEFTLDDFLFDRVGTGGTTGRKVMKVSSVAKGMNGVMVSLEDLGGSMGSTAIITPDTLSDYSSASETDKLYNGFITEDAGYINNDEDTIDQNLIF